jgi:hypothetical protein
VNVSITNKKKLRFLMNMKYIKVFVFGVILNSIIAAPAISGELVSWNNTVASNFSAQQCVTIHGISGTPRKCAPSYKQKYPCGNLKHPTKTCHHTIAGPCTAAIPGTPDVHQCANINLGNFSIAVDGGVYTEFAGIDDSEVSVQTTVNVSMFGKKATLPLSCKISIGKKISICFSLLTRTFTGSAANTGYSCEIAGAEAPSLTMPGVAANFCMDVSVAGVTSKPMGTVTARIEADVEFGGATVAGHSLSMGSKGWNPALFSVKF